MSEQRAFYVIEASGDGSRDSEIIVGTKEDARKKLCDLMFFGTYEEAQENEMIAAILEHFDDEENCWGHGVWEESLEQGYLRVARIDRFTQLEECERTLAQYCIPSSPVSHYAEEYFKKWGEK